MPSNVAFCVGAHEAPQPPQQLPQGVALDKRRFEDAVFLGSGYTCPAPGCRKTRALLHRESGVVHCESLLCGFGPLGTGFVLSPNPAGPTPRDGITVPVCDERNDTHVVREMICGHNLSVGEEGTSFIATGSLRALDRLRNGTATQAAIRLAARVRDVMRARGRSGKVCISGKVCGGRYMRNLGHDDPRRRFKTDDEYLDSEIVLAAAKRSAARGCECPCHDASSGDCDCECRCNTVGGDGDGDETDGSESSMSEVSFEGLVRGGGQTYVSPSFVENNDNNEVRITSRPEYCSRRVFIAEYISVGTGRLDIDEFESVCQEAFKNMPPHTRAYTYYSRSLYTKTKEDCDRFASMSQNGQSIVPSWFDEEPLCYANPRLGTVVLPVRQ